MGQKSANVEEAQHDDFKKTISVIGTINAWKVIS